MLVAGGVGVGAVGVGVGVVGADDPPPHETRMTVERVMKPSCSVFTMFFSVIDETATLRPVGDLAFDWNFCAGPVRALTITVRTYATGNGIAIAVASSWFKSR